MRSHAIARVVLGAALMLALAGAGARADVRLPALFTDGMVLQQGVKAPVWGWADDGEKVTVRFNGQEVSAVAQGGKWKLSLAPMRAGGPWPMTVAGKNTVELPKVFVGEVWIASGQSNMQFGMRSALESEKDISASANPMLRLFTVPNVKANLPMDDVKSQWLEVGPATAANFSAVAYYFGRDLQRALNVPVGIIHTSWGGSPAEVWMSRRVLDADAEYRGLCSAASKGISQWLDRYTQAQMNRETILAQNKTQVAEAQQKAKDLLAAAQGKGDEAVSSADAQGKALVSNVQRAAAERLNPRRPWVPGELYNGMISPLIPYAIKGAIWYQGESNAGRAYQYRRLFTDMIRNWRDDWGLGDFPFLLVQLAPYMQIKEQPAESSWAELREAQLLSTTMLPNVGMAVITDVGEENDIHPKKKAPVGARLALEARRIAYGEKIASTGPLFHRMRVKGNQAILSFRGVGAGLEARGGELTGFAVCGADHKFAWAKAEIQGDTVVVSCPEVAKPVAVRFGWADYPVVNLWNKDGLPATPFRTDDLPMQTGPKRR